MAQEEPIFGLRFGSNASLQPDNAELSAFLNSPKRPRVRTTHAEDFAAFRSLVGRVFDFEHSDMQEPTEESIRDRMLLGALRHTSICSPGLLAALELYKFYFAQLCSLDFNKPQAFISAAEKEIAALDPHKKSDAERISRLKAHAAERRKAFKDLERQEEELVVELLNIATYVRDNLARITQVCEKAIVLLSQLLAEGAEERRLLRDVRELMKDELKAALQQGTVTRMDLISAQQELEVFSAQISAVFRDHANALTSVYEAVRQYGLAMTERIAAGITAATAEKGKGVDRERDAFASLEEVFVSFLSGFQVTMQGPAAPAPLRHAALLMQKRQEMLNAFFGQVRKERRERRDRRALTDRRKQAETAYQGIDQRSGSERRTARRRKQH